MPPHPKIALTAVSRVIKDIFSRLLSIFNPVVTSIMPLDKDINSSFGNPVCLKIGYNKLITAPMIPDSIKRFIITENNIINPPTTSKVPIEFFTALPTKLPKSLRLLLLEWVWVVVCFKVVFLLMLGEYETPLFL